MLNNFWELRVKLEEIKPLSFSFQSVYIIFFHFLIYIFFFDQWILSITLYFVSLYYLIENIVFGHFLEKGIIQYFIKLLM